MAVITVNYGTGPGSSGEWKLRQVCDVIELGGKRRACVHAGAPQDERLSSPMISFSLSPAGYAVLQEDSSNSKESLAWPSFLMAEPLSSAESLASFRPSDVAPQKTH